MKNKIHNKKQCITCSYGRVHGKAKSYPYFQPCLYEEYITKDNRKLWKLKYVLGTARRSKRLAEQDALDFCKQDNIPYIDNIRQWCSVD
jgi:hypothetical protein